MINLFWVYFCYYSSTSTAVNWWERSPNYNNTNNFCNVNNNGNANNNNASNSNGFVPDFSKNLLQLKVNSKIKAARNSLITR